MSASVRMEEKGGVVTLRLVAPARRNALTPATLSALGRALSPSSLGDASAVVITGDGSCFSAGADLDALTGTVADVTFDDQLDQTVAAIRGAPVPILAAIEGACIGAAVDLAIGCDVRVASKTAFFEVPAVRLGFLYNPAGLRRIREALPPQTIARLLLLGERIDAGEAVSAGLVCCCVPAGGALVHANQLATYAQAGVREAIRATKGVLTGTADPSGWQETRVALLSSPSRRQAIEAARARLHFPKEAI